MHIDGWLLQLMEPKDFTRELHQSPIASSIRLAHGGVEISRSTSCAWMRGCVELLTTVYERMK